MTLHERRMAWRQVRPTDTAVRVALLGTFTMDPLVPLLGMALRDRGIEAKIRCAPYNQVAQECLDEDSDTTRFDPDIVVVWPRLEEVWAGLPLPLDDDPSQYEDALLTLIDQSVDGARGWRSTLVFVLPCPPEVHALGLGDSGAPRGIGAVAAAVRGAAREQLADMRGVLVYDAEVAVRRLGTRAALDPRFDAMGHIPFSQQLFAEAAQDVAKLVELDRVGAKKAVVVDADGTLWGGVVGEDGAARIELSERGPGHGHLRFQSFLLELRRAGVLLALCSKNDERDVWEAFGRREMRLRKEHLAASRIGWEAKSRYIRSIAEELNIGLDAIVFIDDSPVEIAEVEAALPTVTCIRMPRDSARWFDAVRRGRVLDRLKPTREDLRRADDFAGDRARREHAAQEADAAIAGRNGLDAYVAGLNVRIAVRAPKAIDMARLHQLVIKTNQFNINCRRRTEVELEALVASANHVVRIVDLEDRFGSSGIVGVYILQCEHGVMLDTFLLSCRAMGRHVERAMLAHVVAEAAAPVSLTVMTCPRNEPARRFFASAAGARADEEVTLHEYPFPDHVTVQATHAGARVR